MLTLLKRLFGLGPAINYKTLLQQGAIIVDGGNAANRRQDINAFSEIQHPASVG